MRYNGLPISAVVGAAVAYAYPHFSNTFWPIPIASLGISLSFCFKKHKDTLNCCIGKDPHIVQMCLNNGVDPNAMDNDPFLNKAIKLKDFESAIHLINAGADVNRKGSNSYSPLHMLCLLNKKSLDGFIPKVVEVFEKEADVRKRHFDFSTLDLAVLNGWSEFLPELANRGFDLNGVTNIGFTYLIQEARKENNAKMIKALIDAGADPNGTDHLGNTALMFACGEEQFENAQLLLNCGAHTHQQEDLGYTALDLALKQRNYRISLLLINQNAPANVLKSSRLYKEIKEDIERREQTRARACGHPSSLYHREVYGKFPKISKF